MIEKSNEKLHYTSFLDLYIYIYSHLNNHATISKGLRNSEITLIYHASTT